MLVEEEGEAREKDVRGVVRLPTKEMSGVRCCMAREILVAFIVVAVGGETVTWDGGDVWRRTDGQRWANVRLVGGEAGF